jgi:hypothetical protein
LLLVVVVVGVVVVVVVVGVSCQSLPALPIANCCMALLLAVVGRSWLVGRCSEQHRICALGHQPMGQGRAYKSF